MGILSNTFDFFKNIFIPKKKEVFSEEEMRDIEEEVNNKSDTEKEELLAGMAEVAIDPTPVDRRPFARRGMKKGGKRKSGFNIYADGTWEFCDDNLRLVTKGICKEKEEEEDVIPGIALNEGITPIAAVARATIDEDSHSSSHKESDADGRYPSGDEDSDEEQIQWTSHAIATESTAEGIRRDLKAHDDRIQRERSQGKVPTSNDKPTYKVGDKLDVFYPDNGGWVSGEITKVEMCPTTLTYQYLHDGMDDWIDSTRRGVRVSEISIAAPPRINRINSPDVPMPPGDGFDEMEIEPSEPTQPTQPTQPQVARRVLTFVQKENKLPNPGRDAKVAKVIKRRKLLAGFSPRRNKDTDSPRRKVAQQQVKLHEGEVITIWGCENTDGTCKKVYFVMDADPTGETGKLYCVDTGVTFTISLTNMGEKRNNIEVMPRMNHTHRYYNKPSVRPANPEDHFNNLKRGDRVVGVYKDKVDIGSVVRKEGTLLVVAYDDYPNTLFYENMELEDKELRYKCRMEEGRHIHYGVESYKRETEGPPGHGVYPVITACLGTVKPNKKPTPNKLKESYSCKHCYVFNSTGKSEAYKQAMMRSGAKNGDVLLQDEKAEELADEQFARGIKNRGAVYVLRNTDRYNLCFTSEDEDPEW